MVLTLVVTGCSGGPHAAPDSSPAEPQAPDSSSAGPQAPGTFRATGSMVQARRSHFTATLLLDGRVLIAGGENPGSLDTAELYDPATGEFTATGSMTAARHDNVAVRLADGRVLIEGMSRTIEHLAGGGIDFADPIPTAELYDPRTGTFTLATATNLIPSSAVALLPDGRVLLPGGSATGSVLAPGPGMPCANAGDWCQVVESTGELANALLLDPITGTVTSTSDMTQGRSNPTATPLLDGRVLVTNGFLANMAVPPYDPATAELYDPVAGTFTATGSMVGDVREPYDGTATLLSDGRVLFAGGTVIVASTGYLTTASAQIYDPKTGTFALTGQMAAPRQGHAATLLKDGRVLVVGGYTSDPADGSLESAVTAELFDPTTGTFRPTGAIVDVPGSDGGIRGSNSATLLSDGRVFVAGTGVAEIFQP